MQFLVNSIIDWPGFNERVFTEDDLQRICRRRQRRVMILSFRAEKALGWFAANKNRRWLFVNSKLEGWRRLEIAFHELAHGYFHGAGLVTAKQHYHTEYPTDLLPIERQWREREELEADSIAVMALIPRPIALALQAGMGLPDDHPFAVELAATETYEPGERTESLRALIQSRIDFRLHILKHYEI
jgi:hypothetical protein